MSHTVNVNFRLDEDVKKVWKKHVQKWDCQ